MNLIPGHSRIWQADGENNWSKIGSAEYESLEMPQNGYIVAYLSNQSAQEAWFDNMNVGISNGMLLEERHYYAYGLPIAGLGSQASNASRNRQRYQGNEYIEERGLDWMDFHNRQYDPQLGRFLSIDPLADAGGQQVLSPYHAMGCNPVSMVDPLGLQTGLAPGTKLMNFMPPNAGVAYIEGKLVVLGANFLNLESMRLSASDRFTDFLVEVAIRDAWGGQKKGSESGQSGVPESGSVDESQERGDKKTKSGDKGTKDENKGKTYRLPNLTDEDLNNLAKSVGSDPSRIRCNIYSLKFVEKILAALNNGVSGLDLAKLSMSDKEVEDAANAGQTKSLLDDVGAKNAYSLKGSAFSTGLELERGNIPYVIEYNGSTGHRVVVVSITYNISDPSKSSARVYDPRTGKIEDRSKFFERSDYGMPIVNAIYNYKNSFIIQSKQK